MLLFVFWWACSTPEPAAPPPESPAAVGVAAPSADVFGLTLGASRAADIEAWLAARGLDCDARPSARRTTTRYSCAGTLPPSALPERGLPAGGELHQVLLVRHDEGPLTHVSVGRRYSLPSDAAADYSAAVAEIGARLGAPALDQPVDVEKMDGRPVRWETSWRFSDVDVRVSLMRLGGDWYSVTEQYDVPGADRLELARAPTTKPSAHPGGAKKPWWHP